MLVWCCWAGCRILSGARGVKLQPAVGEMHAPPQCWGVAFLWPAICAVPSNEAIRPGDELVPDETGGEKRNWRPYLGLEISDSDAEGLRVVNVRPESAAAKAGLHVGDHILVFNDLEIETRFA